MFDKSKLESSKVDGVLTLTYNDENAFKNGTEISFKTLKEVEDYQHDYVDKAVEFIGQEAHKAMEKDSKITSVVGTVPYTTSKRGSIEVLVNRSKTFPGINGNPPVTKSKVSVKVTAPQIKATKKKIEAMEEELTKTLLS